MSRTMKTLTMGGKTYEIVDAKARYDASIARASAIFRTAIGSVVTIDDASDASLSVLKIRGKTEQKTTSGAQLFDGSKILDRTTNGVTFTNDGFGVITLKGTADVATSSNNIVIKDLAPGTYYASGTVESKMIFYVRITHADGNFTYVRSPKSFTLDGTETEVLGYLYAPTAGVTFYNEKIYPMLNAGDQPISWEPYTGRMASPNPDYPQELHNAENPTTYIHGKNLACHTTGVNTTASGMTIVAEKYSSEVTITGTAEKLFSHMIMKTEILSPGKYTVSAYGVNNHDSNHDRLYVADYYTNKVFCNYVRDDTPKTFELTEPTMLRVDMVFAAGSTYNGVVKIQLEAGETVTEYTPSVPPQSMTTPVILRAINNIYDEINFEKGRYIQRVYSKTFDGVDGETITLYSERADVYGFALKITDVNMLKPSHKAYCTHFKNIITGISSVNEECFLCGAGSTTIYVMIKKDRISEYSVEAFKAWLSENPITVVFQLATPIETVLPDEVLEAFKELHTLYPNTTIMNDTGAGMTIRYAADTLTYFDNVVGSITLPPPTSVDNGKVVSVVDGAYTLINPPEGGGSATPSVTILEKTSLNGFTLSPDFGIYIVAVSPPPFTLTVGETYKVFWDDVEYSVEALDISQLIPDAVAMGNGPAFGMGGNAEAPFIIVQDSLGVSFAALVDYDQPHTVAIYQGDSVATESFVRSYVEQYIGDALGGEY